MRWSEHEDFVRLPRGGSGFFNGYRLKAPLLLYEPRKRVRAVSAGWRGQPKGRIDSGGRHHVGRGSGHVHFTGPVSGDRGSLRYTLETLFMDVKRGYIRGNNGVAELRIDGEKDLPENVR